MHYVTHGHTIGGRATPTFNAWHNMISRCENERNPQFHLYGGRGITVDERWKSFAGFLEDMGERPPGRSIDRFPNNDGNYELGNCRWATAAEQAANRRTTKLSFELAVEIHQCVSAGETVTSLAARMNVSKDAIWGVTSGRKWKGSKEAARQVSGQPIREM